MEKLVLQQTSELEQGHNEALNAQAQVHAGKVKELDKERDGLKEQALKLSREKDTLNGALTEAQGAVISKAGELAEAINSVGDLKLKLKGLEEALEEAKTQEETLAKALEDQKQLQENEGLNFADHVAGENRKLERLAAVANQAAAQFATMGMSDLRYVPERSVSANCSLTLFFDKVVRALERLHANRAASLAEESRILCQGAMTKVLPKVLHWYPDLHFDAALESLPEDVYLAPLRELIKPIISRVGGILRVEGQRRD